MPIECKHRNKRIVKSNKIHNNKKKQGELMTEAELYKEIESRYGSGILMAFADLIESEDMKTYETEKHNIPEGATHYSNADANNYFAWYKTEDSIHYLWCVGISISWERMDNQEDFHGEDVIKIPVKSNLELMMELAKENNIDIDEKLLSNALYDVDGRFKQKRTKTEYIKVTESIFDLKDEFDRGELYNKSLDCSGDFVVIKSEVVLLACGSTGNIYRRVEVSERDEFIENSKSVWGGRETSVHELMGYLYDAGCRFVDELVEGK